MTKKDYILIAKVIKARQENSPVSYKYLVKDLCIELEKDNQAFNTERFYQACGITE
jgi:hypothetical protein